MEKAGDWRGEKCIGRGWMFRVPGRNDVRASTATDEQEDAGALMSNAIELDCRPRLRDE